MNHEIDFISVDLLCRNCKTPNIKSVHCLTSSYSSDIWEAYLLECSLENQNSSQYCCEHLHQLQNINKISDSKLLYPILSRIKQFKVWLSGFNTGRQVRTNRRVCLIELHLYFILVSRSWWYFLFRVLAFCRSRPLFLLSICSATLPWSLLRSRHGPLRFSRTFWIHPEIFGHRRRSPLN